MTEGQLDLLRHLLAAERCYFRRLVASIKSKGVNGFETHNTRLIGVPTRARRAADSLVRLGLAEWHYHDEAGAETGPSLRLVALSDDKESLMYPETPSNTD